jgi:hypothetical protein
MDGLKGRQPPRINLFKSMTSPAFTGLRGHSARPGLDAYILAPDKTL